MLPSCFLLFASPLAARLRRLAEPAYRRTPCARSPLRRFPDPSIPCTLPCCGRAAAFVAVRCGLLDGLLRSLSPSPVRMRFVPHSVPPAHSLPLAQHTMPATMPRPPMSPCIPRSSTSRGHGKRDRHAAPHAMPHLHATFQKLDQRGQQRVACGLPFWCGMLHWCGMLWPCRSVSSTHVCSESPCSVGALSGWWWWWRDSSSDARLESLFCTTVPAFSQSPTNLCLPSSLCARVARGRRRGRTDGPPAGPTCGSAQGSILVRVPHICASICATQPCCPAVTAAPITVPYSSYRMPRHPPCLALQVPSFEVLHCTSRIRVTDPRYLGWIWTDPATFLSCLERREASCVARLLATLVLFVGLRVEARGACRAEQPGLHLRKTEACAC